MRLGVYGGSFDPVHFGHLLVAENCREQRKLDEVWFIPAATSPHKQHATPADAHHRVEMLHLAVGGHEPFRVSTVEIDRGGVSYTVDTLEQMYAEEPNRELFLILGADALEDLPTWKDPQRICQLALPLVVCRAYAPDPDFSVLVNVMSHDRIAAAQAAQVTMAPIGIASSDIRRRVAGERSIRFRTPRAVEKYIETHGLYRQQI
ncbi:MAG: nicotinate-nucleotide adenylyltransferase [Pirellulales bacterium]